MTGDAQRWATPAGLPVAVWRQSLAILQLRRWPAMDGSRREYSVGSLAAATADVERGASAELRPPRDRAVAELRWRRREVVRLLESVIAVSSHLEYMIALAGSFTTSPRSTTGTSHRRSRSQLSWQTSAATARWTRTLRRPLATRPSCRSPPESLTWRASSVQTPVHDAITVL